MDNIFDWAFTPRGSTPPDSMMKTENAAIGGGVLAMAFVNPQPMASVYDLPQAFSNGTLFPDLNKPFYGGKCP